MIRKYIDFIKESTDITVSGKGIFNSFLKAITSLGKKENSPSWDKTPGDFIYYWNIDNLKSEDVKAIFKRFKSLTRYINYIDYSKNELDLYFGVRCDGNFEYGIKYEESIKMGVFKLSSNSIRWICQIDSKSAASLKKELVNLSYNDLVLLGKIKNEMNSYNPGYHEKKSNPIINNKIITFGYYGLGKWENGKIDEKQIIELKESFKKWLLSKKWADKVLINLNTKSFWVNLSIKIK